MPVNGRGAQRSGEAAHADLTAIADSVRGTFQTVEGMTLSFMREAILRGIYRSGERLNQDAIAEALGVSRMPVRAGLRQLEAEGLVQILPNRGATVSVLTPSEIAEIYELRILIEGHLLELALTNVTDEALADLEELVGQLDGDPLVPERLDRRKEFYERLYELADRPRALGLAKQLRDSVGRYLLMVHGDDVHSHEDLMVHLRSRDTAAAKRWLAAHLKSVSRRLQQVVSQAGNQATS
jgi:DNA-binding GntR family transcriptional regulator